ncbi:Disease resistance protein RPM1 [Hordeum vulgare]|uniref:Disease resistance protein RPM1 n=1 Tax=Hordeum vulgare subsp. vulgare TaxID=112509 RepID=A0A8I7BI98_HORVV|nr:Disease resistance protein RPM1 [Hordeum vulgare]
MMQSFLMAAHDERDDHKVVKTWVKQVRDLGYNVEDCLQDFAVRLEKPSCWWRILRTLLDRRHVAVQMKDLRAMVEDISQRNLRYHLIRAPASGLKPEATTAEQYSAGSKGATMFGVDEARRAVKPRVDLAQLINKEQGKNLRVIAVWGTCGVLGQASVIRHAYDDSDNFECRAWIKLTHPFDPIVFMQSIMRQFYGYSSFPELASEVRGCRERTSTIGAEVLKKMLMMKQEDLVDEFKEHVNNKSYLIVLTDLCSIEDWDWIVTYFPVNNNGNRIIVATQQVEVASLCVGRNCQVSELKQLSADQTLYVFYHKGPQGGIDSMKPEPSSNTLSTSCEIASDQANGADGKNLDRGSLTRMMTITAALEGSQVIGRETEKSHILRLIIDPAKRNTEIQVISVWGMGGMGKTALVKDIYQSQELAGVFEKRACVTVMSPSKEELLRSLVKQLAVAEAPAENVTISLLGSSAKTPLAWSIEKFENQTEILLKEKRCLIFFDDLSSTADWDMICASLPQMENASRIIVTTREENIANYCSKKQENVCKLEILNKEHALGLFTKKVFKENECLHRQYPELVEPAEQILKKCNGLPLPIVAIGGFLANQPKTATEWRKLSENLSSELEMNPELDTIRTVLLKSYDGLPYHLKACFLYLAIFPEDYKISLTRLVRRWIAEGYSREGRSKSSYEMAESYFMDLISRSMILPSQRPTHSRKEIDSCQVHDIIREIGVSKSMEENLVFRLEEGCTLNSQGTTRHLSVSNWKGDESEFESTVDLSRVRSITIFGKWKPFFISDKMRLLRVLDLEDTTGLVDHHLKHIGKLFHLRYLSLRGCQGIYHLPDSVGNLRQLQTLDVRGTSLIKLPKTIIKLRKLQHVRAGGVGSNDECFYQEYSDEIPKLMRNKLCIVTCSLVGFCVACYAPQLLQGCMSIDGDTNRRDVCTACCCAYLPMLVTRHCSRGIEVPQGIHKLKTLHTLGVVNISRRKVALGELARLTGLRKLGVTGINESNGGELCSALARLSCLEKLLVQSEGKPGLSGCLDGLSSLPEKLESLKLYGNLVRLPIWMDGRLKNLAKLKLRSSRLSDHDASIQVLGSLPNLTILRLRKESFECEEVHLRFRQGAFQTLMVLELSSPGNLKSVVFENGATPKLELLQYSDQPEEGVVSNENPEEEVVSNENDDDQFEEAHSFFSEQEEAHSVWLFSGLASLGSLKEVLLEGGGYKADFVRNLRSQLDLNPRRPLLKMD